MTEPLKLCPFCGGEASLEYYEPWCVQKWIARCRKCSISFMSTKSENEVIEKWNTRAKSAEYEKLLAFVKEVNDNFCFNQTDDEGLRKLVEFEQKAEKLLEEIGEDV